MALLTVNDLGKSFAAETLFEHLTFEVHEGERIGIVGANGCGKSTLFRMLAGAEVQDHGNISRARGLEIGWLTQDPSLNPTSTAFEEVMTAFARHEQTAQRMRDIEEQLSHCTDVTEQCELLEEHAILDESLTIAGDDNFEGRARATLASLGLRTDLHDAPCGTMSGGERCRVALARMLLTGAQVLLLDEPTNHLDLEGIEWLEEHLIRRRGAALVISHDRRFLDRVTTSTLAFTKEGPLLYRAAWSRYDELRKEELVARRREYEIQQDYIRKEEEYIRKHIGSHRSDQAKGRRKRLDSLVRLSVPSSSQDMMRLNLTPMRRAGDAPLCIENLSIGYDGRVLVQGLSCIFEPGERIGIVGRNGCGKSTLLSALGGKLAPLSGKVDLGRSLDVGFYSQAQIHLPLEKTVRDFVHDMRPKWTDFEVRLFLARFLFYEEDADRPISQLSGGERGRLALSEMLLARPNMLLLDEPTNHLDIPARQALEDLLKEFTGTLLVVSHDRYFLDQITQRTLWIDEQGVRLYGESFGPAERIRRTAVAQQRVSADTAPKAPTAPAAAAAAALPAANAKKRTPPKSKRRAVATIEADIMAQEALRDSLLALLQDTAVLRDGPRVKDLNARLAACTQRLADLDQEWGDGPST